MKEMGINRHLGSSRCKRQAARDQDLKGLFAAKTLPTVQAFLGNNNK